MTRDAAVVARALEAFNDRRWSDLADQYAGDAVISYPQSGERFVGRESLRRMTAAFPTPPRFTPTAIDEGDGMVVAQVDVDYGSGPAWKGVFLYWLEDGRIATETAYFAAPFDPPEWRVPFIEA